MMGWPTRVLLRLLPASWREAVVRDLTEEADEVGRCGLARRAWIAWQIFRIAARFVRRRTSIARRTMLRRRSINVQSDFRFAWRAITRSPWSTAAMVLTLAIGIGVTTTVYAIFNYALFRPVPGIGDPDGLVTVLVQARSKLTFGSTATDAHLQAMRSQPAFAGLAAFRDAEYPFQDDATADVVSQTVTPVTTGYFDLLRVRPAVGRFFSAEEYTRPDAALAVISERFWRSHFGGTREILGHVARIRDHPFVIIGVARAFRGLERLGNEDVWIPYGASAIIEPPFKSPHQNMIGRLAPGATFDQARQQATVAFDAVGAVTTRDPTGGPNATLHYEPALFAGLTNGYHGNEDEERRLFWISSAGVAILFLLACANAANQLLARNARRRRELAMKSALGATPWRALRELVVEAGVISIASGGLGLAFAAFLITLFRTDRVIPYLPPLADLSIDWRVAAYALAAAAMTIFAAAGAPSVVAVRAVPGSAVGLFMRETRRGARTRGVLVGLQIALSVAVLSTAGVLAETLIQLEHVPLGFNPNHVLTMEISPFGTSQQSGRVTFFRALQARLIATPGLDNATFGMLGQMALSRAGAEVWLAAETQADARDVWERVVTDTYFDTLGIAIIRGRTFTAAEANADRPGSVVVLDERLARQLFGNASPVGQEINLFRVGMRVAQPQQVIGVVAPTMNAALRSPPSPTIYVPATTMVGTATFHVRSSLSASAAAAAMRAAVRDVAPAFPRPAVTTMRKDVDAALTTERLLAKVGLLAALFALGIGAAGVYAVVACSVAERTREFGIRLTLGAPPRAVGGEVVRQTFIVCAVGVAAGVALYAWAVRWIASSLYGVSRFDPATLALAVGTVVACALIAAFLPARRAMRVDPAVTLRTE